MKHGNGEPTLSLGKNIKFARTKRDLTVKALAEKIGVSPSLLSKIEHEVTSPSLDVLREIAMVLHVSVGDLVDSPSESHSAVGSERSERRVCVVKSNERKLLQLPTSGIVYQLLTPDFQGAAELAWVELEPGQGGSISIFHERGEEYALVLQGALHVYVEDKVFVLNKGDCIVFDARLPHRYKNEGDERTVWIYTAVPPTL